MFFFQDSDEFLRECEPFCLRWSGLPIPRDYCPLPSYSATNVLFSVHHFTVKALFPRYQLYLNNHVFTKLRSKKNVHLRRLRPYLWFCIIISATNNHTFAFHNLSKSIKKHGMAPSVDNTFGGSTLKTGGILAGIKTTNRLSIYVQVKIIAC